MHRLNCDQCRRVYFSDKHWSKSCFQCYKRNQGQPIDVSRGNQQQITLLRDEVSRLEEEKENLQQEAISFAREARSSFARERHRRVVAEAQWARAVAANTTTGTVDRAAVRALLRMVHPDRAGALARLDPTALSAHLTEVAKLLNAL